MKYSNSAKHLARFDHQYVWHPFTQMKEWGQASPLIITRGQGPYLYDIDGRRYLDGTSSIWVNIHGHRNGEINRAIRQQLNQVAHTTFLGLSNPPAILLARELIRLAPTGLSRVFYSDDGSTAMEVALKMALQYWRQRRTPRPKKKKFVHLSLAYHGDTVGGMSLSGMELFHKPFRPILFSTHQIDPPYCYRCPLHFTFPSCQMACIDPLEQLLRKDHHHIAAVVIEPLVQAVAGMIPSPPGYLRRIRELCTTYDVLLIADEVATGFGRTGKMFACEHEDVTPDLMAVAKGLTGGYVPLAATLATEEIFQAFLGDYAERKTFFHGHSYTGNPLGCSAALANLSLFKKDRTLGKVRKNAAVLGRLLRDVAQESIVGDVRQCGFMVGIELVKDRKLKTPFPLTQRMGHHVSMEARRRGLLIRPIGNVLVLMPPLCVEVTHLTRMIKILRDAIRCVERKRLAKTPNSKKTISRSKPMTKIINPKR
ncbi:MAG: adenosylmethionine--8-amino-7-oxononanoate transaminase [Nitrospirota bacterium]|nr:MAG: adenosylmethionine--8-amino-7-oxononanoate transaminase [Nitrospirota bacterium]